jgi:hypothetical protein
VAKKGAMRNQDREKMGIHQQRDKMEALRTLCKDVHIEHYSCVGEARKGGKDQGENKQKPG